MKAAKSTLATALAATAALWAPSLCQITQGVTPELFARLDRMASLSMNVYTGALCGPPSGFSRAGFINETTYDIQGQVLRDDAAREAVVVFRGTASDKNFQVDLNVTLAPFEIAQGNCAGCQVHGGFYLAWTAARDQVLGLVQGVLGEFPGYGVVITGHRCVLISSFLCFAVEEPCLCAMSELVVLFVLLDSHVFVFLLLSRYLPGLHFTRSLGGSMASLAATQFQPLFPNLTVYTFGEPRTGDALYVQAVETNFLASSPCTTRYFRSTRKQTFTSHYDQDKIIQGRLASVADPLPFSHSR